MLADRRAHRQPAEAQVHHGRRDPPAVVMDLDLVGRPGPARVPSPWRSSCRRRRPTGRRRCGPGSRSPPRRAAQNSSKMSLSRSPMWTHRDGSPSSSVDCLRFSSQRTLSFCSIGMRVRLTLPLRALVPLNFLRVQNLTAARPSGSALGGEDEAGVHEHPAEGHGGVPGLEQREPADRVGPIAPEAELGGVVQDQDRAGGRGEPRPGGGEVPGEDDALIDAPVAEEAVGGLGGGPVLAGHRYRRADPASQIGQDLAQAGPQPAIGEFGLIQLAVDPGVHGVGPRGGRCARMPAPRARL